MVLTPSLNKSFKFQSDWPYNNSQTYLLQTLLSDIQNDSNKKFSRTGSNYVFTTKVNYPNNSDLEKQKIYFDKTLNIKKVEVLNDDNEVLIKMTFNKITTNKKYDKNYFSLENNMTVSTTEENSKTVSQIDEEIFPMYIPENTSLTSTETVDFEEGQRVIMTFEGDNPFVFAMETASVSDEESIVSVYGDLYQLATSVAAVSDNMISWTSGGIEYYIVAENMSEEELINVASSVSTMPVSK